MPLCIWNELNHGIVARHHENWSVKLDSMVCGCVCVCVEDCFIYNDGNFCKFVCSLIHPIFLDYTNSEQQQCKGIICQIFGDWVEYDELSKSSIWKQIKFPVYINRFILQIVQALCSLVRRYQFTFPLSGHGISFKPSKLHRHTMSIWAYCMDADI